ncbi:unnamed protein product [Caenorhabditis auriculariae]|uniref:Exosome complex component RRP45 n=1 Tax=Caenorhabditis auriculariae TaxID=2777116 RepID=A0A8S1GYN2_9PELO|nr:unnamed protein product [Caenorhabditis auriculariae]
MSADGADGPKGVPLNELGIEQLSQLQKNIEQELAFFQESANTLKVLMARNDKSIFALADLKVATSNHQALIPLSESMYVRAEIADPSKQLVEIGTGYFVELDREKAKAVFERKKENIFKQMETVEKILTDKRRTRAILSEAFQAKVQSQIAAMGPNTALRSSQMRTDPLSTCELQFFKETIQQGQRLEGRGREEFREAKLVVGAECGTAVCTIGDTKVMCAVSAEICEPSSGRPQKGVINIEVDLSPMANPAHEHDRLGQKGMELTRLLELVIRDSRCVDVESLCIRNGKEVWKLRVDVRILDEDGSVLDCACLAAVTALQHFRRPNVTLEPHHTIIHSEWEKAMVPLNIYHMPICVTFGFLRDGNVMLVDPSDKETQCVSGSLVIACNKRREICALHQSTNFVLTTTMMNHCVKLAMLRAESLSELVQEIIRNDSRQRSAYCKPEGFAISIPKKLLNCGSRQPQILNPPKPLIAGPVDDTAAHSSTFTVENSLREDAVKLEEIDEDDVIATQLEAIQKNVQQVEVDTKSSAKPNNRKREVEEVDELLDGLDDLDEGDVTTLEPKETSDDDDGMDLLKAKKKKI